MRAAFNFETMTAFSNWAIAPRTCRISTRVGSPSSAVRSVPLSAAMADACDQVGESAAPLEFLGAADALIAELLDEF